MKCPLCRLSKFETILEKKAIPIFTSADDESRVDFGKHNCILNQCRACGHIFQPASKKLKNALQKIYDSEYAQLTTSLGEGNWGEERAIYLFEKLNSINEFKTKSILEIGCGNGYILKSLSKRGFKDLVGIDPSINLEKQTKGIKFLREFITSDLKLNSKFDFIFSFGVYEHIDDINSVTSFCTNHLKEGGSLFIYVPNCKKGLALGDPALFIHEHIQYFVPDLIKYHLSTHGYEIVDDQSDDHAIAVYAKKNAEVYEEKYIIDSHKEFQNKINEKLELFKTSLCKDDNVIIHGACNSLNNILGWQDADFNFTLVDNDNTKYGKTFYDKKVEPLSAIDLANYGTVLILPAYYSDAIKADYLKKGFQGKFVNIA